VWHSPARTESDRPDCERAEQHRGAHRVTAKAHDVLASGPHLFVVDVPRRVMVGSHDPRADSIPLAYIDPGITASTVVTTTKGALRPRNGYSAYLGGGGGSSEKVDFLKVALVLASACLGVA
jgi:hypothetical protein